MLKHKARLRVSAPNITPMLAMFLARACNAPAVDQRALEGSFCAVTGCCCIQFSTFGQVNSTLKGLSKQ